MDQWNDSAIPDDKVRRREEVREFASRLPLPGEIIYSKEGQVLMPIEDWKDNNGKPFRSMMIYARIDEDNLVWYLSREVRGLVCFIVQACHDTAEQGITALRVIKRSKSGKSLICEAL